MPVTGDALGIGTEDAVKRMRPGEVILLENLRFHAEEEKNDPEFAAALASYADVYVNDAFGTAHRAHASTVGIAKLLPAYAGLLMEREITMLSELLENPERPFAAILGGAKVSDKIKVIDHLLTKVDVLVLGGGMANTFLLAQGKSVGKSLAEHDRVDDARRILAAAEKPASRSSCRPTSSSPRRSPAAPSTRRCRPRSSPPRGTSSTSGEQSRAAIEDALEPTPGPSSGTARSACSRSRRSPTGRMRSPASWPTRPRTARRSSSVAATASPRSSSRAWPTR